MACQTDAERESPYIVLRLDREWGFANRAHAIVCTLAVAAVAHWGVYCFWKKNEAVAYQGPRGLLQLGTLGEGLSSQRSFFVVDDSDATVVVVVASVVVVSSASVVVVWQTSFSWGIFE